MITYILVILAAISAAAILFMKEVFHAALSLIVCLLCVAGIFVTFNAEFLAVVQIIVYAGGVLLLIIFGIMLTNRTPDFVNPSPRHFVASSIIGVSLLSSLVYSLGEVKNVSLPKTLSPEEIGTQLVTTYLVDFELAGMLLLVSFIGAIVAATNLKKS
jgi:NADH:ubiquinone oxidoreductase subunit 6 (subunit J)